MCHCNLAFCSHVLEPDVHYVFFDQDQNYTGNVQVKVLLRVFCFTFLSLKTIRPRTLNIEKTWNGLIS
jgi:hypothetical protein